MKIAITGGTGFVGRHLARSLVAGGHEVVLIARGQDRRDLDVRRLPGATLVSAGIADEETLVRAFAGCAAVAHCAGINREIGEQTYENVHVQGTRAVARAAQRAGVEKVVLLSFLRARPNCGIAYHESKWQAEEIVRQSGLDYTILKSGIIYGKGDHLLDHLSHALHTFPLFGLVGGDERLVAPVAVADVVAMLGAALTGNALSRQTIAAVGPERLTFREVVRRVGEATSKRPRFVPLPVPFVLLLAWLWERLMQVPLVSVAQVHILAEGVAEPLEGSSPPPPDLVPQRRFTVSLIRSGLPAPGPFVLRDLRCLS